MKQKRTQQIERRIQAIKESLAKMGPMRPGSLTRQYRIPKKQIGGYYQISYTHKMKSRTEYVRRAFVAKIRREIASYKRFKHLTQAWVDLAIERSKLALEIAKRTASK